MENEMMNEVVAIEAVQDIATQAAAPSKGNGLRNFAIVGGIMTLGALAWEFGVKPFGRKVGKVIEKAKDKRNEKSAVPESEAEEDYDVLDDEFPIK